MNGIEGNPQGTAPMEQLLGIRPKLSSLYKTFYGAIWEPRLLPRRVLEICRQRVAAIHACAQEQQVHDAQVALSAEELQALAAGRQGPFDESERVALALAEKVPYRHHEISDAEVAQAQRVFGDQGTVALLIALSFFDVTCRWKLVLPTNAELATLAEPPLIDGTPP